MLGCLGSLCIFSLSLPLSFSVPRFWFSILVRTLSGAYLPVAIFSFYSTLHREPYRHQHLKRANNSTVVQIPRFTKMPIQIPYAIRMGIPMTGEYQISQRHAWPSMLLVGCRVIKKSQHLQSTSPLQLRTLLSVGSSGGLCKERRTYFEYAWS